MNELEKDMVIILKLIENDILALTILKTKVKNLIKKIKL